MKNILIITIGTRDVQTTEQLIQQSVDQGDLIIESYFTDNATKKQSVSSVRITSTGETLKVKSNANEEFSNFYIFSSPRQAGQCLVLAPEASMKWLTFPLIENPLKWLQKKVKSIDYVLTVFTNQDESVAGFHWKDDTLFFNKLIQSFLQNYPVTSEAVYEDYPITKEPVNIDYQYNHFEEAKGGLLATSVEEIENIYLLAQGGIDQINTALTLKLIEHFPNKVVYLQQPEDQIVEERTFPTLFVRNLIRNKAMTVIGRYDYATLNWLDVALPVKIIARYAQARLHFDFDRANTEIDSLKGKEFDVFRQDQKTALSSIKKAENGLLAELYVNAKIKFWQEAYVDFLLRLFRITEELTRSSACLHLKLKKFSQHTWKDDITKCLSDPLMYGLATFLESSYSESGDKIDYTKSSILTFRLINQFYQDPLDKLIEQLEPLAKLRNKSIGAHDFKPVSKELIEQKLTEKQTDINQIFRRLDSLLGITNNSFDKINEQLIAML